MDDFAAKAVILKINRMFEGRHFSICDVDKLMAVTGATRTADYKTLNLFHCVDFCEMDQETKDFVFRTTVANVTNVAAFPKLELARAAPVAEALEVAQASAAKRIPHRRRFLGLLSRTK